MAAALVGGKGVASQAQASLNYKNSMREIVALIRQNAALVEEHSKALLELPAAKSVKRVGTEIPFTLPKKIQKFVSLTNALIALQASKQDDFIREGVGFTVAEMLLLRDAIERDAALLQL